MPEILEVTVRREGNIGILDINGMKIRYQWPLDLTPRPPSRNGKGELQFHNRLLIHMRPSPFRGGAGGGVQKGLSSCHKRDDVSRPCHPVHQALAQLAP